MTDHDFNTLDGLNQYVHKVIESAMRAHAELGSNARLAVVVRTWDAQRKVALPVMEPMPIIMHKSDPTLDSVAKRQAQLSHAHAVFLTTFEDGSLRVSCEHKKLGSHDWIAKVTRTGLSELQGPMPGKPIRMLPASYMN